LNVFVIGNIGRRRHIDLKSGGNLSTTLMLHRKDDHFLAFAHEK
jgi:hypothetical protein